MFWQVRSKFIFAQIETKCTYGQIYVYKRESIKIQTAIQWNVIGLSTSAPQSVLSPNSILPPSSSYCNFISTRKAAARVSQMLLFQFFFFLLFKISFKLRKSGIVSSNSFLKHSLCISLNIQRG